MQALAYGGYSEAALQKLLEEQCDSNMQQRRELAQQMLADTQSVLDRQAAAWNAACAAMGQLLTQLSEAHDQHKQGHAALQSGVHTALEDTKQVQQLHMVGLPTAVGLQKLISCPGCRSDGWLHKKKLLCILHCTGMSGPCVALVCQECTLNKSAQLAMLAALATALLALRCLSSWQCSQPSCRCGVEALLQHCSLVQPC